MRKLIIIITLCILIFACKDDVVLKMPQVKILGACQMKGEWLFYCSQNTSRLKCEQTESYYNFTEWKTCPEVGCATLNRADQRVYNCKND